MSAAAGPAPLLAHRASYFRFWFRLLAECAPDDEAAGQAAGRGEDEQEDGADGERGAGRVHAQAGAQVGAAGGQVERVAAAAVGRAAGRVHRHPGAVGAAAARLRGQRAGASVTLPIGPNHFCKSFACNAHMICSGTSTIPHTPLRKAHSLGQRVAPAHVHHNYCLICKNKHFWFLPSNSSNLTLEMQLTVEQNPNAVNMDRDNQW